MAAKRGKPLSELDCSRIGLVSWRRMNLEDRILFVDGEAIVIDKPEGLPVDPPRAGGDSIEARIDELKLGFKRPPVPMHRLDRDTSGCLLLARNPRARAFPAGVRARRGRPKPIWRCSTACRGRRRADRTAGRQECRAPRAAGGWWSDDAGKAAAPAGAGSPKPMGRAWSSSSPCRAAPTSSGSMRRAGWARRSSATRSIRCPTMPSWAE